MELQGDFKGVLRSFSERNQGASIEFKKKKTTRVWGASDDFQSVLRGFKGLQGVSGDFSRVSRYFKAFQIIFGGFKGFLGASVQLRKDYGGF